MSERPNLPHLANLPRGTVTFLFTDIEGSTRLWAQDHDAMAAAHGRHDAVLHEAIAAHGGVVFKTVGDAVCAAFPSAPAAVAAAVATQRALAAEEWPTPEPVRVRTVLHSAAADPTPEGDYRAPGLNRLGRLLSTGHGGQVLLSQAAMELARGTLPAGVFPWDLGAHRLKDLLEPEHIYQLVIPELPGDFPPLRTLDRRPHNLPLQPTPMVGREREVTKVTALLRQPGVRLVTLTGPGGIGKTRLGLQVAAELSDDFADGVFYVPLALVTDPARVPVAIAAALGVREAGERPLEVMVREEVGSKHLLLVLDNFEQVTAAAPVVAELLAAGPHSKVLVTSRLPLRLQAEHQLVVPPLPLPRRQPPPTADRLTQYEAVRLFIERAQAVRAGFAVTNDNAPAVAEICHRLDGLPLAIELAAARVKLLPPAAMLARLEKRLPLLTGGALDLPERQRTLRGAIAWSHDLLSPDEQALFRRLSTFAGGFTWGAVEVVAGSRTSSDLAIDVLEGLNLLVDHSLVRQAESAASPDGVESEPRFVMLETIREFGLEQLHAIGEANEAQQRHAAYILTLAEEAEPALWGGPDQRMWLDRLEGERDNLRAALSWASEHEPATAARLGAAVWRVWLVRGPLSEGQTWLERLLTAGGERLASAIRASLLHGAGTIATARGDFARAKPLLTQGLALTRASGDTLRTARMLHQLGTVSYLERDFARGEDHFAEALPLFRQVDDARGVPGIINNLGEVARERGDLQRATELYEESLALAEHHGDEVGVAIAQLNLGMTDLARDDLGHAQERLGDALSCAVGQGDIALVAAALVGLASVAARHGQPLRAARLLGTLAAHRERTGISLEPMEHVLREQTEAYLRQQLDQPLVDAAVTAGRSIALDEVLSEALGVANRTADTIKA